MRRPRGTAPTASTSSALFPLSAAIVLFLQSYRLSLGSQAVAQGVVAGLLFTRESVMPSWTGISFAVFPTVETLAAQAVAAVFVLGSYGLARRSSRRR